MTLQPLTLLYLRWTFVLQILLRCSKHWSVKHYHVCKIPMACFQKPTNPCCTASYLPNPLKHTMHMKTHAQHNFLITTWTFWACKYIAHCWGCEVSWSLPSFDPVTISIIHNISRRTWLKKYPVVGCHLTIWKWCTASTEEKDWLRSCPNRRPHLHQHRHESPTRHEFWLQ